MCCFGVCCYTTFIVTLSIGHNPYKLYYCNALLVLYWTSSSCGHVYNKQLSEVKVRTQHTGRDKRSQSAIQYNFKVKYNTQPVYGQALSVVMVDAL